VVLPPPCPKVASGAASRSGSSRNVELRGGDRDKFEDDLLLCGVFVQRLKYSFRPGEKNRFNGYSRD